MAQALVRDEGRAARGEPVLVEHPEATLDRLLSNPSHANAFVDLVMRWAPAEEAIEVLEQAIALHGAPPVPVLAAAARGAA
jgi:hypothetical protein